MTIDTAELRRLHDAATKGEFSVDGYNTSAVIFRQHGKMNVTDWMPLLQCAYDNANWKADAAYVAAALNALPELLDRLEKAEDKIEGLQADLDNAVETAFVRGAKEWTRLNYPDRYRLLSAAPKGGE